MLNPAFIKAGFSIAAHRLEGKEIAVQLSRTIHALNSEALFLLM